MACLTTNINTHSEQYQENYRSMASLVDQLYTVTAQIEDGGGEKAREHQQKKGKLPVRERILALLDPGSVLSRNWSICWLGCVSRLRSMCWSGCRCGGD